jgi:hypothetical protein
MRQAMSAAFCGGAKGIFPGNARAYCCSFLPHHGRPSRPCGSASMSAWGCACQCGPGFPWSRTRVTPPGRLRGGRLWWFRMTHKMKSCEAPEGPQESVSDAQRSLRNGMARRLQSEMPIAARVGLRQVACFRRPTDCLPPADRVPLPRDSLTGPRCLGGVVAGACGGCQVPSRT